MMAQQDRELLDLLDRRDVRGAATCLVKRHADEVFGLCRAMVRDATVAEDLSQDVFGKAFSALAGFRGEASSRTWILRIARNHCIDYLRAVQRATESEDDTDVETAPDQEPAIDDLLARHGDVAAGLEVLSENERAMVMLRFGHGLEYKELADTFGLNEGTARMRVSRAIAKMRTAITPPMTQTGVVRSPLPSCAPSSRSRLGRIPAPPPARAPAAPPASAPSIPSPAMAPPRDRAAFLGPLLGARGSGSGGASPFNSQASSRLRARLGELTARLN